MLAMSASSSARPWLRPVRSAPREQEQVTDDQLISAVLNGQEQVAGQMYDALAPVIDRTLYRVFGRREYDHDDLVQAAFEQVILTIARGSYRRGCSLKTWAARVSGNVALNALRSRRRERRVLDHNAALPLDGPDTYDLEGRAEARSALKLVRAELAQMNPRRSQAILLHDIEGYGLEEIAKMTNTTVAAAQSRLVRARKELLKRINGHERRSRLRRSLDK